MMSRLCLLTTLLCLPLGCFGLPERCMDKIDPPLQGVNNYKAYRFEEEIAGDCDEVTTTCSATIIPNATLTGRTWFITNIKPHHGLSYDNNVIQEFRVQCPRGTVLHLFVQQSDLPSPVGGSCNGVDSVRIQATGLGANDEVTFCGNDDDVRNIQEIYNNGLGRIIADGKASISFCSNNIEETAGALLDGFVVRATCLNPAEYELPGCTDLTFFSVWDPEFTDLVNMPLGEVEKVILPHRKKRMVSKRSATQALKHMHREKKFVDSFELSNEETVFYNGWNLTITFANGTGDTRIIPQIFCFQTFNEVIGARTFYFSSMTEFRGPGELKIFGALAVLQHTIAVENFETFFLPSRLDIDAANIIYNYIYQNYISAYPVIDETVLTTDEPRIFPLPSAHNPPKFPEFGISYSEVSTFNFVREDIQDGVCKRAILIAEAPSPSARLPKELTTYCAFFAHSCDLTLRVACRELNRLDSRSVGK